MEASSHQERRIEKEMNDKEMNDKEINARTKPGTEISRLRRL